jgi:hypothetical protein
MWLALICCLVLCAPCAMAQRFSGSLAGVVVDPDKAAVPGASVVLTDNEKGYVFTGKSDAEGRYLFRNLAPGNYRLKVKAASFREFLRDRIVLTVNQNSSIDVTLELATVSQTVSVTEEAAQLATVDAVTGGLISRRQIESLPLIDRNVMDLTYLTPGITEVDNTCKGCGGTNFISNGSRNATADVLMDGVTVTNYEQNGGIVVTSYTPSPEAVEEFKVQQSNFSAEFGFSGATVVNMVTRSGTNAFHGSGYDFLRNQVMDANYWFNNANGVPIAPLRRNNYGGTIGGPIVRNRTFFFFDWDGTRQTTMSSAQAGVPSADERTGNFGELCTNAGGSFDSAGRCSADAGQIWDPYTGTYDAGAGGAVRSTYIPFDNMATYMSPGAALPRNPGNLIDPAAAKLIQAFPLPNMNVGTSAYNPYDNWIASGPNYGFNDQFDIKIDHRFNEKNQISGKYSQDWNHSVAFRCFSNIADPCGTGPNKGTAHVFALNDSYSFSPHVLLSVSYGFARNWGLEESEATESKVDALKAYGFPSYLGTSGWPGVPAITIGGGYFSAGPNNNLGTMAWSNLKQGSDTHQLSGTVSWVKGAHELKFGMEGRMHRMNFSQPGYPNGGFNFDWTGTSEYPASGGGDAMASFLTGFGTWGSYEIPNSVSTQNYQMGLFIQDNWKLTSKLTLNIGLRHDVTFPRTERYNRTNWLDPYVVSPLQVPGMGTLYGGEIFADADHRTTYDTDWKNFQPRFGLAYQVSPKTVVRAGYGMFFSQARSGAAGTGAYGFQGYDQYTNWMTVNPIDHATPFGRLSDPFPNGLILPPGNANGLMNDVGYGAVGPIRYNNNTPYEQAWSFGIQRQLPSQLLVDVEYIGKKGTHLYYAQAGELDHLGGQVEKYSRQQIADNLLAVVNNPLASVITDPNSSLSASTIQAYQLQLPFPQFTNFTGDSPPYANSIYNALQLSVEKRFSAGLQFLVTYTWSKSIDDASTTDGNMSWLGGLLSLQDPNNRTLERSLSSFDIPQVFQFSYTYDLPFGKGRKLLNHMPRALDAVIGGWETNGLWRFASGRPIVPGLYDGLSLPTYGGQRPNLVANLKRNTGSDWMTDYFANPDALQKPDPYAIGNAPRTLDIRQPGSSNAALSVFKEFPFTLWKEQKAKLQLRGEAMNALNHPVFNGPDATVDGPNFGLVTSQANSPREVQVALKLLF